MKTENTYYKELITKYLSGNSSVEETGTLMNWIGSDPENAALFEEYYKTWDFIEKDRVESMIDVEDEWREFERRAEYTKSRGLRERMKGRADKKMEFMGERRNWRKIELWKDRKLERQKGKYSFHFLLRVAAIVLFFLGPGLYIIYYYSQPAFRQVTAESAILDTTLPDGTGVTLNTGSSLEFPSRFKGKDRNVKLHGEGYFRVKHDERHPFIISNDNFRIEVLGTTFYVDTSPEDGYAEVVLTSGAVAVYYADEPNERVLLQSGERANILVKGRKIEKTQNTDPNYLSWKTKTLIFNGDPLAKIIPLINKVYHSDIRIVENSIAGCELTATFAGQSLESVLNVLQATLDLQIRHTGTTIELSGNGCK